MPFTWYTLARMPSRTLILFLQVQVPMHTPLEKKAPFLFLGWQPSRALETVAPRGFRALGLGFRVSGVLAFSV